LDGRGFNRAVMCTMQIYVPIYLLLNASFIRVLLTVISFSATTALYIGSPYAASLQITTTVRCMGVRRLADR